MLFSADNVLILGTDQRPDRVEGAGRQHPRRRAAAPTRSCCGGSAAAPRGGCRSRATRRSTSPGHGDRQDQRGLCDRGPGADDQDRRGVHGDQDQPRDHRQPGRVPAVHRRDRRRRRDHREGLRDDQRRRLERRLHAEPQPRDPPPERDPGAHLRADAREQLQPGRLRPDPRRSTSSRSSTGSRASCSRSARSSGCRGPPGTRRRCCGPTWAG